MAENGSRQQDRSQNREQEQVLASLLAHIQRERGLEIRQYKESFLHRRLTLRLRVRGVDSYEVYLHLLRRDPKELDALLAALSINVSSFFRDVPVFDALRDAVLAPLAAERARSGQRSIRIWSAGCASGEEPYSVAMIVQDLLNGDLGNWNITIHATDIDEAALAQARKGIYRAASFQDLQADYIGRFFSRQGDKYVLQPKIRRAVTFQQHDLTTPCPSSGYDLILCRNVLIYFDRQHQSDVVQHLAKHLNQGGYLVLGMAEMIPMGMTLSGYLDAVDGRLRIYRKRV